MSQLIQTIVDVADQVSQNTYQFRNMIYEKTTTWLDTVETTELVCTTTYSELTLQDEWNLFWLNVNCPNWDSYRTSTLAAYYDGIQGLQSVLYWVWLTIQPWLYGMFYIVSRITHAMFGNALPYLQRWLVAFIRLHLNFTWQQWLVEFSFIVVSYGLVQLYRYIKQQQYWQRFQQRVDNCYKWIQTQQQKVTKVRTSKKHNTQ